MSKHTPGPWSDERVWDIPETKVHAYCCGKEYALAEVYSMPEPGEREANARLIAAAPELYEALRRALNWLSSYPGGGAMAAYDQARAAIDKASQST